MIANSRTRVEENTAELVNSKFQQDTRSRLLFYAQNKDKIESRLRSLDKEWDVERAIEVNASTLAFTSLLLSLHVSPAWKYLSFAVLFFLFQHGVQGWCPPVTILRRLGFRAQTEINEERALLKIVRGDYNGIMGEGNTYEAVHPQ